MDFAELWWCPGIPRSCHPIWQQSGFAIFTNLSWQLFASFSKFLPMFLFPPFPLSSPCSAGGVSVGSAFEAQHSTFTKGFAQGGEDLKLVQESSGQKFCPLPEIWFKGKWVGSIQLIETVVFVNTPCKQKVFLLVWNQHLHQRSLTAKALEKMGFCRPIFRG